MNPTDGMDEKEPVDNSAEEAAPSESPVDAGYIQEVKTALDDTMPEDFSPLTVEIPTDAPEGSEVSMLITGTAAGGKVANAYAATIPLNDGGAPDDSAGGKLQQMFGGGSNQAAEGK